MGIRESVVKHIGTRENRTPERTGQTKNALIATFEPQEFKNSGMARCFPGSHSREALIFLLVGLSLQQSSMDVRPTRIRLGGRSPRSRHNLSTLLQADSLPRSACGTSWKGSFSRRLSKSGHGTMERNVPEDCSTARSLLDPDIL